MSFKVALSRGEPLVGTEFDYSYFQSYLFTDGVGKEYISCYSILEKVIGLGAPLVDTIVVSRYKVHVRHSRLFKS